MKVPERLKALAELFAQRNALYGDNYLEIGAVLKALHPGGVVLKTAEEFRQFATYLMLVHKLTRYAKSIGGKGHQDSLDDLAVYSQMLAEIDEL